ncbi:MAG: S8 family serine peptidase [Kangiellaceae bacterium]|nr:S8 family serine peptidase [Kangiellaceae bacterium]
MPYKGEGQIIAVIDTGINSDHESFADIGDDGYDHTNPLGAGNYLGQCAEMEFADRCNDKLIGVYTWDKISEMYNAIYFQDGYPDNPPQYEWQFEQIRPIFGEDYNGHGSHTASTAAGNVILDAPLQFASYDMDPNELGASGDGRDTGLTRQVSGVAPHANVIMYQACWAGDGVTSPYYGCPTEATLASIEQAVLDGADVINYSISGWGFPWDDAIEQAFYSAYAAGISVAASAGNAGFGNPTNHNSPWLMNVAATHHDRVFDVEEKTLSAMSGGDTTPPEDIGGSSISGSITGEIVLGETFGDKSCDTAFAANTFTADQIVVCERSDQPRIDKANNLVAAGAGGFILYNKDSWGTYGSEVQDMYPLPSIHITKNEATPLLTWLATGSGHTGTISSAEAFVDFEVREKTKIATFTSAAENPTWDGSLTPTIGAPGVEVMAAYSDDQPFTAYPSAQDWHVISGTSMASPHVAGALALIRQAHPDWTVSEVQSAAQMTANPNTDDGSGADPFFRSGSGLIDVAAAVNAGFIMDETAENMMLANPMNGGDSTTLNLPALVNTACKTRCSWIRTITATKDGTWSVTAAPNHDPVSIKIEAQPSQFAIKAGESRSIVVTAEILDATARVGNTEDPYLFGDVKFTAAEDDIPSVHWPVKMKFSRNNMPQMVPVVAHRDNGKYRLNNIPVEKVVEFTGQAYAAVVPNDITIELDQDDDYSSPIFDQDMNGTATYWIDVPAGAKRVFAETLDRVATTADPIWQRGDADVFVGIDANEDGEIDFSNEAICWSYSEREKDFCSINNPNPGRYWIIFHNYKHSNEPVKDTYRFAYGVVTDEIASDISVTTTTPINATTTMVDVDIEWDFSNFNENDVRYTAIDFGTSSSDAGNLGLVPVNVRRGINDVSINGSQTQARPGDLVDMNIHVLPNMEGADRSYTLTATLPEGTQYVEGSAMLNNMRHVTGDITVEGNQLTISGTQIDSSSWNRNYIVTTNETDEACRMPLSTDGGYIDFNSEYGFSPSFGGHWNDRVRFNFKDWFPAEDVAFAPYHNTETMPYESINISSQGWVQFDEMPQFWADHYPFAPENIFYGGIPDTMIAPLFRGGMFDGQLGTPYFAPPWWDQSAEPSGVTIAYNDNPKALIIEWDDARTESAMWDPMIGDVVWTEWGDRYDFETYISLEYNFGDNQHEIVMAYDNLQFADENNLPVTPWLMDVQGGSIGLYGFYGPRGTFSPLQGASVTQFAFGDIDRVLHDGLIVCYDYTGPEATQFDITFQLAIDNNATGRTMNVEVVSQVEGIADTTAVHTITSPSNITVGAIADQMTNEDVTLTGVEVIYNDTDPSSNTISASGDNVTVTVNGHESGSTIDITPDENWYGETEITVIVADNSYSNDAHSVSFMLSVVSDGLAAGCTDPTATNYDANAQEDDGSCTLPAPEPAPTPSSSGSGSMNLFLLLLAVFGSAGLRRKK